MEIWFETIFEAELIELQINYNFPQKDGDRFILKSEYYGYREIYRGHQILNYIHFFIN